MPASAGAIKAGQAYVSIGADLSQLDKDLAEMHKRVRGGLDKLKPIAAASAAIGASIAAGFGLAVKAAGDFQAAMVEVEKVTDRRTAAALSGQMRELAKTIPLSQNALAGLAADAARFGVRGTENIESFVESVSKMAIATDLTSAEAGVAFSKIAALTDTPIPKIENLGSAINELSNNFATSAGEIVDSTLRSGAALSQLGLSQTEIVGVSAALNAVSESSQRAGTRLRAVAQELMDPRKLAQIATAMGITTEQLRQMRDDAPVEVIRRMAATLNAGGAEAERLTGALSRVSRQALAGLGQNLQGLNDALGMSAQAFDENTSLQKEFEAASKTLWNQLTLLWNGLRDLGITIGDMVLPAITKIVQAIGGAVGAITEWIKGHKTLTKGLLSLVVSVGAAGATFASFIGIIWALSAAYATLRAVAGDVSALIILGVGATISAAIGMGTATAAAAAMAAATDDATKKAKDAADAADKQGKAYERVGTAARGAADDVRTLGEAANKVGDITPKGKMTGMADLFKQIRPEVLRKRGVFTLDTALGAPGQVEEIYQKVEGRLDQLMRQRRELMSEWLTAGKQERTSIQTQISGLDDWIGRLDASREAIQKIGKVFGMELPRELKPMDGGEAAEWRTTGVTQQTAQAMRGAMVTAQASFQRGPEVEYQANTAKSTATLVGHAEEIVAILRGGIVAGVS